MADTLSRILHRRTLLLGFTGLAVQFVWSCKKCSKSVPPIICKNLPRKLINCMPDKKKVIAPGFAPPFTKKLYDIDFLLPGQEVTVSVETLSGATISVETVPKETINCTIDEVDNGAILRLTTSTDTVKPAKCIVTAELNGSIAIQEFPVFFNHLPVNNEAGVSGYGDRVSYAAGEDIKLFVHMPNKKAKVEILKFGKEATPVGAEATWEGEVQNYLMSAAKIGPNWKLSGTLKSSEMWRSGIYLVKFSDDQHSSYWPFVIRPPARANKLKVLVIASTNTWCAYNAWGGASIYRHTLPDQSNRKRAMKVSLNRPYLMSPFNAKDHLLGGEQHILRWLEENNHEYSVASDFDIHFDQVDLQAAQTLILSAHPEYWTTKMYDKLEAFLAKGGNLMYLGGNGVYWRADLTKDQLEVTKSERPNSLSGEPGLEWDTLGRSEAALLGVHYTASGYQTFAPYKVLNPKHWIFEKCDVKEGSLIGQIGLNRGGASGHETDKITVSSPKNLVHLAKGTNPDGSGADMIYYDHPGGGGVFSVGSITFGGSLVVDSVLTRMVNNVLRRFTV